MSKAKLVGLAMMLGGYGCVVAITYICWTGEYATFIKSMSDNLKVLGVAAIAGLFGHFMVSLKE